MRQVFYSFGFLIGFTAGPYLAGWVQLLLLGGLLAFAWAVLVRSEQQQAAAGAGRTAGSGRVEVIAIAPDGDAAAAGPTRL